MTFRPATLFAFLLAALSFNASTFYVRTDGGSDQQCTGRTDSAYPGSGTAQPCAWDHPFRAMPPGGTPRIAGGDTLVIGAGSYMMGAGAPGADALGLRSLRCLDLPHAAGAGAVPTRRIRRASSAPDGAAAARQSRNSGARSEPTS